MPRKVQDVAPDIAFGNRERLRRFDELVRLVKLYIQSHEHDFGAVGRHACVCTLCEEARAFLEDVGT